MVVPGVRVTLLGVPGLQLAMTGVAQHDLEDAQILEERSADSGVPAVDIDCWRLVPADCGVVCGEPIRADRGAHRPELAGCESD